MDCAFDRVGILPHHRPAMRKICAGIARAVVYRVVLRGPSVWTVFEYAVALSTVQYHSPNTHVYFSFAPMLVPLLIGLVVRFFQEVRSV